MQPLDESLKKVLEKYGQKLDKRMGNAPIKSSFTDSKAFTKEYEIFRREALSFTESLYERACAFAATIIKIKPKEEEARPIQKAIDFTHLNVTTESAYSLATLVM